MMSRYLIASKGTPIDQIVKTLISAGATGLVKHGFVNQISCDLSEAAALKLAASSGFSIRAAKELKSSDSLPAVQPVWAPMATEPDMMTAAFAALRSSLVPPLDGEGLTVALLDTGIRKTHVALVGKIVHEFNATASPTTDDVWGHGTGTAYLICGVDINRVGIAPAAHVMNIKVIDDLGIATTETLIAGIDHVIGLVQAARLAELSTHDPMYPTLMNISIGGEDEGDPDDPVLLAVRAAVEDYGIDVIAAAGNFGPDPTSITSPGCDPSVVAVGGVETGTISLWNKSSRGPTKLGHVKPDFTEWATDIVVATSRNDTGYEVKSGTSFSSPMIAGMTGLVGQAVRGLFPLSFGPDYIFRLSRHMDTAAMFCAKPSETPLVMKDNNYGYGTPIGELLSQAAQQYAAKPMTQQMADMLPFLVMLGLMAGMVGG